MSSIIYDGSKDLVPINCTMTRLDNGLTHIEIRDRNGREYDVFTHFGKIVNYKNVLTFRSNDGNWLIFKDIQYTLGIYSPLSRFDTAKFICYSGILYAWHLHTDSVETSIFGIQFSRGKDLPLDHFKKDTLTLLVCLLRECDIQYNPTLVEYGTILVDYDSYKLPYVISDGLYDINIMTIGDEN